ncbi:MAG TPA: DNA cytosine methyltransferase [Anaerolineales bacterium]|nr:DNA cytosine methyltransferase [Anaerolineales bacterium]
MSKLVLSLFPGIGLLDMAFEQEGFCVVRGPDELWGGDIHAFHPPPNKFDGVIGGPPCQSFSSLRKLVAAKGHRTAPNLIPEFERCIGEARPDWFLMENVRFAPLPVVPDYAVKATLLNARSCGSKQNRVRRFSFGVRGEQPINLLAFVETCALEPIEFEYAVLAGHGPTPGFRDRNNAKLWHTVEKMIELQGLPKGFLDHAPFTSTGKRKVIGNGVPLLMGRAVARAVQQARKKMTP